MKKLLLGFLAVCFCGTGAFANAVNVLILKGAPQTELTFLKNYAVVIGDHYYGPFSPKEKLQLQAAGSGIRLTVRAGAGSSKNHSLGVAKEPVQLVSSLGKEINFTKVSSPLAFKRKNLPLSVRYASFIQKGDFVKLRQRAYGGNITYSGPLTVYAQKGLNIVESVALEEYVTQVVNCELGGEKSLNALKAQSVMVRTFALYMVKHRLEELASGKSKWKFFQLFSTPVDQAYNCRKRADDKEPPSQLVKQAVKETAGEVLMKKNELAKVQYNTCASKTLPKGVICQEKMVRMAREGNSYRTVLAHFIPGSSVKKYDWNHFYTNTVKSLLQAAFNH